MVEVRTRSERRSEKKQSFVFIAFLVTVAIVCFASGFMVGRNTAPKITAQLENAVSARQPIAQKPAEKVEEAEKTEAEKLTFYEALPKGEQPPMGSGINLPPQAKVQTIQVKPEVVETPAASKTPIPEKVFETAKVEKPQPKAPAKSSADLESTKYILQVASFAQPNEAGKLVGRLTTGGYDVFMQQVDLGSKGVWYRVFVGPVTGKSRADAMQSKIEKDFKVKPIIRKQ